MIEIFRKRIKKDVILRADTLGFTDIPIKSDRRLDWMMSCHRIMMGRQNTVEEVNRLNTVQEPQANRDEPYVFYCMIPEVDIDVYSQCELKYKIEDIEPYQFGRRGIAFICFDNPDAFYLQRPAEYLKVGNRTGLEALIFKHVQIIRVILISGTLNDNFHEMDIHNVYKGDMNLSLVLCQDTKVFYYKTFPKLVYT